MTSGIGEKGENRQRCVKLFFSSSVDVVMANEDNVWKKGNEGLIVEAKKISFLFSSELLLSAVTDDEGPLNILLKEYSSTTSLAQSPMD